MAENVGNAVGDARWWVGLNRAELGLGNNEEESRIARAARICLEKLEPVVQFSARVGQGAVGCVVVPTRFVLVESCWKRK